MTEEEAKTWAKDKLNQAKVVEGFFADYPPTMSRSAFFMAGIPGAGKTEFANNTINEIPPKLIPIEHDRLVEYISGYTPENYYTYRKAGSVLVTRILNECLSNGYGFIFDGTLSHENGSKNIDKAMKCDYYVLVVYIVQDITKAWQLTQDRELITKRSIEKTGFIDTCNKLNVNLLGIFNKFKDYSDFSMLILNKNGDLNVDMATAKIYSKGQIGSVEDIESELKKSYDVEQLGSIS